MVFAPLIRRLQFIPARGWKLSIIILLSRSNCIAIYPRKGTETPRRPGSGCSFRLQFIPARGRKLVGIVELRLFKSLQFIPARGWKLTSRRHGQHRAKLQFTPARGRKHLAEASRYGVPLIAIYPRKGTETLFCLALLFFFYLIAIYPRKGTETSCVQRSGQCTIHYNLSPQGDKKAPLPLAFASSRGALLFPIFYFTGWELRLPGSSL